MGMIFKPDLCLKYLVILFYYRGSKLLMLSHTTNIILLKIRLVHIT
jgi:hypothetical protein